MKRVKEKIKKINEITKECVIEEPYLSYFQAMTDFIMQMERLQHTVKVRDWNSINIEELEKENLRNFEDILPQNYHTSYANPTYAQNRLDRKYGPLLSYVYMELRKLIPLSYEQNTEMWIMQLDLFTEIYQEFNEAYKTSGKRPIFKVVEDILYWNRSDFVEVIIPKSIDYMVDPFNQWVVNKIMTLDLVDEKYLYSFGEYVTENEVKLAKYIAKLPNDTIQKMADTFTEGYRMGFLANNKDLSIKKTVEIRYCLGFERVVRQAITNFSKMGLETVIRHASIFGTRVGFVGPIPNKQCIYDHKEDNGLYMDKVYVNRKLEVYKAAYEKRKTLASFYAGPAVMEVFGEEPFTPENKKENVKYADVQKEMNVYSMTSLGEIVNQYIKGEERSFTIISFPTPAIGADFEKIFDETITINTLDYMLYQSIQQCIIDVLDRAEGAHILGTNGNHTDLYVRFAKIENPEKETKFENCVADVNIPVGEVFTSPVLEGTNGVLHVKKVFLYELEYQNLELTFKDGMIVAYSCTNFDKEEDNKRFIEENILHHHKTLPIGEFAIGTNTTAYVMTEKYKIADKMPILIAEKMGPHFAVGDTCYSHSEDLAVFNPDKKEIIARDNKVSLLRKTENADQAYLNCHTDITIPYEELAGIWAIHQDHTKTEIIENGRFVLSGTEELNKPFRQND